MSIKDKINEKMKDAMRTHDEDAKRAYRMALASIKFIEKEDGKELSDEGVLQVLQKELKIRRETLAEALKGGRESAAAEAEKDIAALESLLPKQLTPEELKAIIAQVVEEVGAKLPSDMGKVMKGVMPKVKGLAANDMISKLVKEVLSELKSE